MGYKQTDDRTLRCPIKLAISMKYLETLCHLKIASFKNAVRLFCDACIIYDNKSYASALALAILSLEEIGKYEMAEHLYGDAISNPQIPTKDVFDSLFDRGMFRDHKNKQVWSCRDPWHHPNRQRLNKMLKGDFDEVKQNALYVGFENNRLLEPCSTRASVAYSEIVNVFNLIKDNRGKAFTDDCGEWLFSGASRQFRYYRDKALLAFNSVERA
jgi:AbiV family abortive infection protein